MRSVAAVIGAFVVLCAACGGGEAKRADTISAPSSGAVTPGASGQIVTPAAPTAIPSPTPSARASVDAKRALLALEDMPTGFTVDPPKPDSGEGTKACQQSTGLRAKAIQNAEIQFTRTQLGPFVSETIGIFKSSEAKEAFDHARMIFEECRGWTETDADGKPVEYRLSPLSFPKLGEQTFAMRLDAKGSGFAVQGDVVFIRRGDAIMLVGNVVAGLGLASVDSVLTEQVARKADEKLQAAR